MGDSVKSFAEINANHIHCSPLIHQATHFTEDGYQVGQAQFPLCKFMVPTPSHLFVFNTFGNPNLES